jgi:hypothetical protein
VSASFGSASVAGHARLAAGLALALVLVLLVLVAAGCSTEDSRQRAVRIEVQRHVAEMSRYDGETHCTRNPRPWFVEQEASVFICAVHLLGGGCDWFKATVAGVDVDVRLDARDAGCVLPV